MTKRSVERPGNAVKAYAAITLFRRSEQNGSAAAPRQSEESQDEAAVQLPARKIRACNLYNAILARSLRLGFSEAVCIIWGERILFAASGSRCWHGEDVVLGEQQS